MKSSTNSQIKSVVAASDNMGHFGALENLEGRTLMSVSMDSAGWTVVTPSSDSRLVYVSNSQGNDANTGLSADAPVKTLAKAVSLLRDKMPDQLLLKRGDTWVGESFDNWAGGSGRSASEPKLISAYGTGNRPVIVANNLAGWSMRRNVTINNLYLIGIEFKGNRTTAGIDRLAAGTDMLVEDCSFTTFGTGMAVQGYYGPLSNFRVRRTTIADNYSPNGGHSQGMYINYTKGMLVEESVFWKNGFSADDRSNATVYNHGMYFSAHNDDAIVRKNIIADTSSHGVQMRGGGLLQDNLFVRTPIGFSYGLVNGASLKAGGVSGEVSGNVVIEANDIKPGSGGADSLMRGWAVELGNIKPGGFSMRDNIFSQDKSVGDFAAIQLDVPQGPSNPNDSPGINDLTIENNIVYNWQRALNTNPEYTFGGSGLKSINNLTIKNNQFTISQREALINRMQPLTPSEESWSGNQYYDTRDQSTWFRVQGGYMSFNDWKNKIEPTAKAANPGYVDPNRTVGTYNASIGGVGTYEAFIQQALKQQKAAWDQRYTAGAVIKYIRDGFAMSGSTTPSVTITASTPQTIEGSSTGGVFTVSRSGSTSAALNVAYTVGGTATSGQDYTALNGVLTIPAGASSAQIVLKSLDDSVIEASESVTLTLSSSSAYTVSGGTASATIVDNEEPLPAVGAVTWVGLSETQTTPGEFMLRRVGSTAQSLTVNYQLSGTATAGVDYVKPSGQITFPAGADSVRLQIYAINDSVSEGTETIVLDIIPGAGYTVGDSHPQIDITDNGNGSGPTTPPPTTTDTVAPSAKAAASNVATSGGASMSFTVTYTDNVAINATTIGTGDVVVTGPNGYSQQATLVSIDSSLSGAAANGPTRIATYQITAPGGVWDNADNGTYSVKVQANAVTDTSNNGVAAATLSSFSVAVPTPSEPPVVNPPPTSSDTVAPTASASAGNITTTGGSTASFIVTYSDNVAIDVATLGNTDVRVTGPNGYSQLAKLISVNVNSNGAVRTATYQITAPGGAWDTADSGTYNINMVAAEVKDTSGNAVAGGVAGQFLASFVTNRDPNRPYATLSTTSVTPGTLSKILFNVTYAGPRALNTNTIGQDDVIVTGPNGFSQVAKFEAIDSKTNGNPRVATYSITAPGGAWDAADAGSYAVSTMLSRVADTAWEWVPSGLVGTLAVGTTVTPPPPVVELPAISVAATQGTAEGSAAEGIFTLTRSGSTTSELQVPFTLSGDAVLNSDYTAGGQMVAVFAAGSSTATVKVMALDDAAVESAESVKLTITSGSSYTVATGSATLSITDNDIAPPPVVEPPVEPPPAPVSATAFASDAFFGDLANYQTTTSSRWSVVNDGGDKRLMLNTTNYNGLSGSRVGEMALAKGKSFNDFAMSFKAKSNENLASNSLADYAVVFGYVDANNYLYLMMNAANNETCLFKVANGQRSTLATSTKRGITDTNYHDISVVRTGTTVTVKVDGNLLMSAANAALGQGGLVGVGAFNDSAYFDDITVAPVASPSVQPASTSTSLTSLFNSSTSSTNAILA